MRARYGRWAAAVAALVALWGAPAHAEGLRLSTGFQAVRYPENVNLYMASLSARVSRGRAGMSFSVPMLAVSGGRVSLTDEQMPVVSDTSADASHFGFGDMMLGLDYNVIQNRQTQHIYIVTLSGNLRFRTGAAGLGGEEDILGAGLSGVYGVTRQLIAYLDLRQTWSAIQRVHAQRRASIGELGAVYWLTDKLGFTASLNGASYLLKGPDKKELTSFELNAGVLFELIPGVMMNAGGLSGLAGQGAPRAGGSLGFSFDI